MTDKELHKWLVSQLIQENGALTADRIHKNGYVFGIFQYNVRAHTSYRSAASFMADHPEWLDVDFQLRYMADMVKERVAIYDGNISCIVLHHFHPYHTAKAPMGADWLYARFGNCESHKYYHTDVAQRLALLTISE